MRVDELEDEVVVLFSWYGDILCHQAQKEALSRWGPAGITPSSTVVYNKGI